MPISKMQRNTSNTALCEFMITFVCEYESMFTFPPFFLTLTDSKSKNNADKRVDVKSMTHEKIVSIFGMQIKQKKTFKQNRLTFF